MQDNNVKVNFNDILEILPAAVREVFNNINVDIKNQIYEVRIRTSQPVSVVTQNGVFYIDDLGNMQRIVDNSMYIIKKQEVMQCFQLICGHSVYSYQDQIKNGFITIKNGHRVGVAGTGVIENHKLVGVRDVSSLNIRISRDIVGVANPIIEKLYPDLEINRGIILAGPPSSGKTTILRDIARQFSIGKINSKRVCVIDERGEIAAVYGGLCANNLGSSCDILDNYPKGEGIMIALRCFSPDLIICDEIGTDEEVFAVESGLNAGVPIVTSIHANSLEDILKRKQCRKLIETNAFEDIVLLGSSNNPGVVISYEKVSNLL